MKKLSMNWHIDVRYLDPKKRLRPSPARCNGLELLKKKKTGGGHQGKGGKKAGKSGLIPVSMRKEVPPLEEEKEADNGDKIDRALLSLAELVLAAATNVEKHGDGGPSTLVEKQQQGGANNCLGDDEFKKVCPGDGKDGGVQPIVGGEPGQAPTSRMK